ncbi:MAG TPA: CBS domain-containing protein [Gaiella sp.]|nr:CBS domain-containing protein [Gaiella sp.]
MTDGGTIHRTREDLAHAPIASAITIRGKELARDATIADARALFASGSVQVLPVLEDTTYVGTIARDAIPADVDPELPVAPYVSDDVPVVRAGMSSAAALDRLDRAGGSRLVVLADSSDKYVGLVCLRSDRMSLCVDAECHADPIPVEGVSNQ